MIFYSIGKRVDLEPWCQWYTDEADEFDSIAEQFIANTLGWA